MKFNKKSLVKVAILSAILGLNGMCFDNVVNGAEVAVEEAVVEEAVVRNGKCAECGTDNPMFNFTTGESLCRPCLLKYLLRLENDAVKKGRNVWVLKDEFITKYGLTEADRIIMNQALIRKAKMDELPGYKIAAENGFPQVKCGCGANILFVSKVKRIPMCYDCITKNEIYRAKSKEALGAVDLMLNEKFIKEYELTEEDRQNINDAMEEMYEKIHVPGFRIAKDGFPEVRVENKNPDKNKNPDEVICPVCHDRKPIKLFCCGNFMCENCILKQNAKRHWGDGLINTDCPFCCCSGTLEIEDPATGAKFDLSRKSAWNDMVKLAKVLNKRAAEKENSEERTLADDLKRFNGDNVSFAREQDKYADANLAELTNERANQLLDEGRIEEVQKMFYEADSYRKDKEILREDIRDEKIEKTSSNCSQNACCEPTSFEKGEYKDAYVNTSYVDIDGVQVEIS